jgi:hypothetical protein
MNPICARCEHFGMRNDLKIAAEGMGRCRRDAALLPGTPAAAVARYVTWNRTCNRYRAAGVMAPRNAWVSGWIERNPGATENGKAAGACGEVAPRGASVPAGTK